MDVSAHLKLMMGGMKNERVWRVEWELGNVGGSKGPESLTLVPTILTSWEGHEGRALLEGLISIQKVLRVEFLGLQELSGVVVDRSKDGDDICALCGWEAESVVQKCWDIPHLGFLLYRVGVPGDVMGVCEA